MKLSATGGVWFVSDGHAGPYFAAHEIVLHHKRRDAVNPVARQAAASGTTHHRDGEATTSAMMPTVHSCHGPIACKLRRDSKTRHDTGLSKAELDQLLDEVRTITWATLNSDGTAHVVPMWFNHDDGQLAISTYRRSQKARNLERDPRVTVMAEVGERPDELRGATIYGTAELVTDAEAIAAYGRAVLSKYTGTEPDDDAVRAMTNKRVLFVVYPDRIVSWDHRKLAGA